MNSSTHAITPGKPAITTDIPFRLDRLPWGPFHWLLIVALGVTWVLDGLEATVVGSIGAALMILAAGVEAVIGVDAEGRALEAVALPLTAEPQPEP